ATDPKAYDYLQKEVLGGAVTPVALRDGYAKMKDEKDKLRTQAAPGRQPHRDDGDRLEKLNQALGRVRAEEVARPLAGRGGRVTLADEEQQREGLAWVVKNRAFDEMCLDFMAPLLRGTLTPTLGRGDALTRFWTKRFGWADATNFNGYRGEVLKDNYQDHHPLVLFNATDVAFGSRGIVGFPPGPADLLRLPETGRPPQRARPS